MHSSQSDQTDSPGHEGAYLEPRQVVLNLSRKRAGGAQATNALAWLCALGALCGLFTAGDVARFLFLQATDRIVHSVGNLKLGGLGVLVGVLALLLGVLSWKGFQPSSPQRETTKGWSLGFVILWGVVLGYFHFALYPLPPENHHVDKLFLLYGVLALWSASLVFIPSTLDACLETRSFGWGRVILVNVVVFVLAA